MTNTEGFDHIALSVPDLDEQVERFTTMLGMVVQRRSEHYALVADLASGFKIELSEAPGGEAKLLHLGFRSGDIDAGHAALEAAGMTSVHAPHRREMAKMQTAFLREANGLEVQLVKYD